MGACENGRVSKGNRDRSRLKSFFPRRKNERRRVELMGGVAVGIFSVLVVSVFLVSSVSRFLISSDQYASVVAAVLVDLANGDRAQNSLHTLTMNPVLVAAAQAKANDMAAKSYFAHVSPEGRDSWYWFKEARYAFSYAGENLAVDFSDSGDVERAWMDSPTHRENLLGPHFTEIGIATAEGMFQGHMTTFVVQMFGTPAGAAVTSGPVRELLAPQDATEPAIATTQIAPANVLGETSKEPIAVNTSAESSAPLADIRTPEASVPIGAIVRYAPSWGFLATSPKTALRYAYYFIGFLVLLALVIATGLEFRLHHARKFVAAACLLVFMSGLFVVADVFLFSEPVLAAEEMKL